MDNVWILYWITRFDDIKSMMGGLQFLSVVCTILFGAMLMIIMCCRFSKDEQQSADKLKSVSKTVLATCIPLFILLTLTKALVPSKEDAMLIAAGVAVTEVVKSEAAGRIASKSVGVIEAWLDKQVEAKKEK